MKIRNGFVSNSSTSSFVAIGFNLAGKGKPKPKLSDVIKKIGYSFENEIKNFEKEIREKINNGNTYWTEEKLRKEISDAHENPDEFMRNYFYDTILDKLKLDILDNNEQGVSNDDFVIAYILAETEDDTYSLDERAITLNSFQKEFSEVENLRKKISPESELTLYTGTRMS